MKLINPSKYWLFAGLVVATVLFGCKEKYVPPNIHWKKDPGEKYNIRVEFERHIRGLTSMIGYAEYDVPNFKACMMEDSVSSVAGKYLPVRRMPVVVRQIDERTFVTSAYKNPLVDEDYYGLGKCEWMLQAVIVKFEGIGGKLVASLGKKDVQPGEHGLRCNKTFSDCDWDQGKPSEMRAGMSKGRVIITGE